MISLFRKIRQKLLQQNRITRYLAYALGEILLVMVGILLALQVNNWNEYQKERKLEQVFLKKLTKDLTDDIVLLEGIIQEDSLMFIRLSQMSDDILEANDISEVDIRDNALFKANLFYPNKIALDNITASGQIGLIRNDSLINNLREYYRSIKIFNEGIDQSLKNYSRDIENFVVGFDHRREHPSLPKKTLEEYRENPFFLNSLYFKNGLLKFQKANYQSLRKKAREIRDLAQSEIKASLNN
ncbi:MAG: hypothetical protein HWE09_00720 [Cyclobacteriaceae bacterium]|nr:hypothetical protein [Cyclobacteriaceae bacterium]